MLRKLIGRPIAVTMSLIIVVILGTVSIKLLPVSLIPDVQIPYITVQVTDHTKSARELHEAVITPLRQQLIQIAGLSDIQTETWDGSGTITLTFDHGSNIDYLFIEANEKVDRAMGSLPRTMDRPVVLKASATDIPAFYINMSVAGDEATETGNDLFPVSSKFEQLSDFANNVIVKRIEQLPEVAMVDLSGYVTPEILIIPDMEELSRINLSLDEFENTIRNIDINIGNLTIRDGEYQYNVRIQNDAAGQEDIGNAYIKISGRLIQVKEVARVIQHPRPRKCIVTSDFDNAVTLAVIKQSDAKMSNLKKNIDWLLYVFNIEYPDIKFTVTRDQTELLDYSINNLILNIILGIIFASTIIFLFMRNLRSSLIVVITIPIALILSMLVFYLLGISINIISLSGLVLGVGMMVDNSIILTDNIIFRWGTGIPLKDAIVKGAVEVFAPMLSSVLTTCSVFIPLIFISGIAGALFYDQAMAVTITLLCSLLATMTVIPVYFFLFFRKESRMKTNRFLARFSFDRIIPYYDSSLKFFFRRRYIIYMVFILSIISCTLIYPHLRKERLPEMTYSDMLVFIDWNERITVEQNNIRSLELAAHIEEMTSQVTVMAGSQQFLLSHTGNLGINEAVIYFKQQGNHTVESIRQSIAGYMGENYPDAQFVFETSGNIFDVVFAGKESKLVARLRTADGRHPEPGKLNNFLTGLSEKLEGLTLEKPVYNENLLYVARPEIMALYNVTYFEMAGLLKNALNENLLFSIMESSYTVPVIIGENKQGIDEILKDKTVYKNGSEIPVSVFFRQTYEMDYKTLVSGSEGNYYPIRIEASDKDIPDIMKVIDGYARQSDDFEVGFSGSYFSNRAMVKQFAVILVISFLLLYFILASQFESLVQPLIILSEMIITVFVTMTALWILDISINIMSLIGLIVTCGIIINDSILKVDTINQLRKEGHTVIRAIMEAGQRRLKAIIMTSLTTILAISPFLVRGDMGSDMQYPLSVTIIVGMTVGTFVSVYFIPVIYYTIYRKR